VEELLRPLLLIKYVFSFNRSFSDAFLRLRLARLQSIQLHEGQLRCLKNDHTIEFDISPHTHQFQFAFEVERTDANNSVLQTGSTNSSPNLDKELPPKPVLRSGDSPERRGIFDATDSASKSLTFPTLAPGPSVCPASTRVFIVLTSYASQGSLCFFSPCCLNWQCFPHSSNRQRLRCWFAVRSQDIPTGKYCSYMSHKLWHI
jgi:hypothetical protein